MKQPVRLLSRRLYCQLYPPPPSTSPTISQPRSFHSSTGHIEPTSKAKTSQDGQQRSQQDVGPFSPDYNDSFNINPELKTVTTAAGDLPLSPAMDPQWHKQRGQWRMRKPKRSKVYTGDFQKRLTRNPYAHALSGSIRQCYATHARLPVPFLQQFRLITHPDNETKWWIPQSIVPTDRIGPINPNPIASANPRIPTSPCSSPSAEETNPPSPPKHPPHPTGPSSYLTSSLSRLRSLFTYGAKPIPRRPETHTYFDPEGLKARARMPGPRAGNENRKDVVFRPDMPDVILKMRRDWIVDQLVYFAGLEKTVGARTATFGEKGKGKGEVRTGDVSEGEATSRTELDEAEEAQPEEDPGGDTGVVSTIKGIGRGYLVPAPNIPSIEKINHRGCILWLPPKSTSNSSPTSQQKEQQHQQPTLYSTLPFPSSKFDKHLIIHNLPLILGTEHTRRLLQQAPQLFRMPVTTTTTEKNQTTQPTHICVLCKSRTRDLQAELWKLHGLLWQDGPRYERGKKVEWHEDLNERVATNGGDDDGEVEGDSTKEHQKGGREGAGGRGGGIGAGEKKLGQGH